MKQCSRCRTWKPVDEFAGRGKRRRTDTYCRPCRAEYGKAHYAANKDRYVEKAMARKRSVAQDNITRLLAFFETHPCTDCGEEDPLVLEFDHLRDKSFTIARALRDRSWADIEAEMQLCEVVCANCHRRRTAQRGQWIRACAAEGFESRERINSRERASRLISMRTTRV